MDTALLAQAGLTDGEIKVYLALLETGETSTGPLIKKAKISPSKVYDILERLIQKGLVSSAVRANRKYFTAADPKRILDYVRERELALAEQRQQLAALIPELQLRRKLAEHLPTATVFEGFKGMKTAVQHILDTLHNGEEMLVLGAYGGAPLSAYRPYFKKFHDERAAKGIRAKMIFNVSARDTFGKDREQTPLTEVKYLPPAVMTPATIQIYNNFTAIALLTEQPLVVRIENKGIADSFRDYFGLIWNERVMVYHGLEGVKEVFRQTLQEKETLFIGGKGYVAERAPEFFWNEYVPSAQQLGHRWKNLAQPGKALKKVAALPFVETKYLPKSYATPHVIFIYGNHVGNVLWEQEPIAYVIHDASVAKSYRDYFDLLWKQEMQTLRGFEGIQALCTAVLEAGHELYLIGANGMLFDRYKKFFLAFDQQRVAQGIRRHHLSLEKTRRHPINQQPKTEARYLPKEFDSPLVIWLFGDTVANILWDEEVVYLTQNRKIADDYRRYFQLLWKSMKE